MFELIKYFVLLILASCSVIPEPLTKGDLEKSALIDRELMFGGNEKLLGQLSLEGAIARALKFNLDSRARSMEQALALKKDLSSQESEICKYSSQFHFIGIHIDLHTYGIPVFLYPDLLKIV